MRAIVHEDLAPRKGITYSKVHLGRLERAGQFPRRITLGPGRVAWLEHEIDAWLEARAAAREAAR